MITYSRPSATSPKVDRTVLGILRNSGTHSLDSLITLTGVGWGQVFMSIDRLSRKGKVSLAPVRPCGYSISIGGLLRR